MSANLILQVAAKALDKPRSSLSHLERQAVAWSSWFDNPIGSPPVDTENLMRELRTLTKPHTRDDELKELGFQSAQEFEALTYSVDLEDTTIFQLWQVWKTTDRTKAGLLLILQMQRQITGKA